MDVADEFSVPQDLPGLEEKMTEDDGPERRAYDTLKGVIYSLNVSDYFKSRLEKELDRLYESWYVLRLEAAKK